MPSGKSKYLDRESAPTFDPTTIKAAIEEIPSAELADLLVCAGTYNQVIWRMLNLLTGFQKYGLDQSEQLTSVLTYALTIDDHVSYDRASEYVQIIDTAEDCLKKYHEQAGTEATLKLLIHTISIAEESGESIQDGDYWEMTLQDLRDWQEELEEG